MISFWYFLLFVMADVMGHGGDGAGQDPPNPYGGFGAGYGHYEEDAGRPRRKTRGKAKNNALRDAVAKNGGPLVLEFDRQATFQPIGKYGDMFTREAGSYMWNKISFDQKGWNTVPEAQKNAMHEHLRTSFDLDRIHYDPDRSQIMDALHFVYQKRYRDRKALAKVHFNENGGAENDLERAFASVPEGMEITSWRSAVEYFLSDKHKRQSAANIANRQAQQVPNRGGTSTYSNTSYKKAQNHLATFRNAHTRKDGTIDPAAAETISRLEDEFASQTQPDDQGPSAVNEVGVFEKVMGTRRRWIRGIGFKPSSHASVFNEQSQPQPTHPFTQEQITSLFQDPTFQAQLAQYTGLNMGNQGYQDNEDDDDNEDDE